MFEVRKAEIQDLNDIYNILKSTFNSYNNMSFKEINNAFIKIGHSNSTVWLLLKEAQIIGVGTLVQYTRLSGGNTVILEDIAIASSFRGQGLGEYFIKYMKEECFENQVFKIIAECKSNKIEFYKRCGFINVGTVVKAICNE